MSIRKEKGTGKEKNRAEGKGTKGVIRRKGGFIGLDFSDPSTSWIFLKRWSDLRKPRNPSQGLSYRKGVGSPNSLSEFSF
jgi:hypothetical protein